MNKTLALVFAITLLSFPVALAACIQSADDYAAEVILNKPGITVNLQKLDSAENVVINDNRYVLRSSYSPSLAVILETASGLTCGSDSGVSVRLQLPIKIEEKTVPFLKFTSSGIKGTLNISEDYYDGWKISCADGSPAPQCDLEKEKTRVLVSLVSSNKYEATIETNEDLNPCGVCDGTCIGTAGPSSRCIPKTLKRDIEDIMKHANLIGSFDELLTSYRLIGVGTTQISDLSPDSSESVDWSQAMQQELSFLRDNGVILITDDDISSISALAKEGAAGQNSRIVYCENKTGNPEWLYYSQTQFPAITPIINCQEFPVSLIPAGSLSYSKQIGISTYYLVPVIITFSLLALFLFLTLLARAIERKKK